MLIRLLSVLICAPLLTFASTRSTSHFRLTFSATETKEVDQLLDKLETQRTLLIRRLAAAEIDFNFPHVEVVINSSTGDFVARTGMPAWAAAATHDNRIELQPLSLLKRRGIVETTLQHELVHVVIDTLGGGKTPRWLAEGIALHVAGEGKLIQQNAKGAPLSSADLESKLAAAKTPADMKAAYAAAYLAVRDLVRVEGENKLWKRVAQRSYDGRARL
jgi:hypothetical protein